MGICVGLVLGFLFAAWLLFGTSPIPPNDDVPTVHQQEVRCS